MALEKPKDARPLAGEAGSEQSRGAPEAGMAQKRRWLVFGSNVVVAVLLATAILVGAIWLSDAFLKGRGRSDWTASGRFSLSPRTKALLGDLKQDITVTNLYVKSPEMPDSFVQQERVQDLLTEYQAVNPSRITVDEVDPLTDAGGTEKLVGRLRQRYAKELEKPKALVEEFAPLNKDISAFLESEAKQLEAAADAWKGGPPDIIQFLRTVAQKWRQLQMVGDFTANNIQATVDQPLPAYSSAINRAKEYLGSISEMFTGVQDFFDKIQARGAGEPAEVKTLITEGKARYENMRKRVEGFLKKTEEVKELELDSIRREISQGQAILIEAPDKVKVVAYEDVWVRNPEADERNPDAPRLFAGESAVSSALLGLVEPERPAVLFITAGAPATAEGGGNPMMGMGGGSGPYARMAERLRKINFIVEDWDVLRSPEMPKPEHMTKAILVFVPPAPPSAQMPMPPPTPELYRAAIEVVKGGAPAIILGEPATMMSPGVPYAELFTLFGITPKFNAISVHQIVDQRGIEKAVAQVEFTTYPDQAITRALNGLPAAMLGPSPLLIDSSLPKGVTATPILLLPAEKDYWADTTPMDVMRGEAKRDEAEDIFSTAEKPVALAVACTRDLEKGAQKVVLFGDAKWALDSVAFFYRDRVPGNAELFVNSVLWAAGTEHLITVSPETMQARRIGDPGAWTVPVQFLTWLGIPAAALAAGIIVYAVRRR